MIALVFLFACGAPVGPDPVAEARAAPLPDDSIYHLEVPLESQAGDTVDLSVHRGHPTVVSMFYASCPMACPMLIQEVRAVESQLPEDDLEDLRVLLVSLDPKRDSPARMTEVMQTHDLDAARWTLTRTDEVHVREVAAVLGIEYRSLDDGEMNHSSILTLVDRQGVVVERVDGLGKDTGVLREAVSRL